ncbi:hypothetical protein AB1Y20_001371 [Prymnesium parvum]|uniref:Alpha-type protein kinase domain-containing protein n=1 Tax=Prymnesium parvum TaxID=97485 RepID=A0AB34KD82_PRYPA
MERGTKYTYLCGADEWHSEPTEVSIEPRSFARGGMRKCHKCFEKVLDGSRSYSVESVAKFTLIHRDEHGAKSAAFADAKMQMVAEYWAQQFNRKSPAEHKVAFVVAQVLELPNRRGPERWASLEPLLSGEYAKFNTNAGVVLGGRTAQAFSHFTIHETAGQICICDLQGVGGSLFTDPQVHAKGGGGYGDGNLGSRGIERFLATHRCNEICAHLGLPKVEPQHAQPRAGGAEGIDGLMRGGMVASHGMHHGVPRVLERMMEQMIAGQLRGLQLHAHRGGPGQGLADARGDELRAALRASDRLAAQEDERRLREALKESSGASLDALTGNKRADLDLQRAIEASVKHERRPLPRKGV